MILDKELLIISTRTHVVTFRPRYIRKVTTVDELNLREIGVGEKFVAKWSSCESAFGKAPAFMKD